MMATTASTLPPAVSAGASQPTPSNTDQVTAIVPMPLKKKQFSTNKLQTKNLPRLQLPSVSAEPASLALALPNAEQRACMQRVFLAFSPVPTRALVQALSFACGLLKVSYTALFLSLGIFLLVHPEMWVILFFKIVSLVPWYFSYAAGRVCSQVGVELRNALSMAAMPRPATEPPVGSGREWGWDTSGPQHARAWARVILEECF